MRRRAPRLDENVDAAAMADTVQQLAVLLQAGASPPAAWRHLAASGLAPQAAAVSAAVEGGASIADALRERGLAWSGLATAWQIADVVGAPLAGALRTYAEAVRDATQTADDVRVALSEPAATARLMAWLPPLGLALGFALGFDPLSALVGGPIGWTCLAGGLLLMFAARRWTASLVRRAQPQPGVPGLEAELLAVALGGGVSVDRAIALVGAAMGVAAGVVKVPRLEGILALSQSAGVPAAELLRADAARSRREARTAGRISAARLSSGLLLPLGACTLPAFILLGVAPMAIAVMSMPGMTL